MNAVQCRRRWCQCGNRSSRSDRSSRSSRGSRGRSGQTMRHEGRRGHTYGGRGFRCALLSSRRLRVLACVLPWLEAQTASVLTRPLRRLRINGARSTSSLLRITGSISRRGSSPGSDRLDSVDHVVGCLGLGPRKPSCYILSRRAFIPRLGAYIPRLGAFDHRLQTQAHAHSTLNSDGQIRHRSSPRLTITLILIYIQKIAHRDAAMGTKGRSARRARAPPKFKKCPGTH